MEGTSVTPAVSKSVLWTGRVLSTLVVVFLLFGAVIKLMKQPSVVDGFVQHGIPERLVVWVGVIELVSVVLYSIPATSVLGTVLITGVMGGAILTNIRVGDPSYIAPIVFGLLAWGALYLREPRLHALLPFRRSS